MLETFPQQNNSNKQKQTWETLLAPGNKLVIATLLNFQQIGIKVSKNINNQTDIAVN